MYCVRVIPSTEDSVFVRTVILLARNSSGTFRRTKVRLSAKKTRRKSRRQLTAGGGEGRWPRRLRDHTRLPPVALPRLPPRATRAS